MPFNKENASKYGKLGGRKGYEYEAEQLEKMQKILNKALVLTEKVMNAKATIKEARAYENSIRMVLKVMDKLHANRQAIDIFHEIKDFLTEEQIDEIFTRRTKKDIANRKV
jgi:hypothetical protein